MTWTQFLAANPDVAKKLQASGYTATYQNAWQTNPKSVVDALRSQGYKIQVLQQPASRPKLQQQSQEDGQCCTSLKNPQLGCAGGCWAPPAPGVCSQSKTDCESGCGGGGNVKW